MDYGVRYERLCQIRHRENDIPYELMEVEVSCTPRPSSVSLKAKDTFNSWLRPRVKCQYSDAHSGKVHSCTSPNSRGVVLGVIDKV